MKRRKKRTNRPGPDADFLADMFLNPKLAPATHDPTWPSGWNTLIIEGAAFPKNVTGGILRNDIRSVNKFLPIGGEAV